MRLEMVHLGRLSSRHVILVPAPEILRRYLKRLGQVLWTPACWGIKMRLLRERESTHSLLALVIGDIGRKNMLFIIHPSPTPIGPPFHLIMFEKHGECDVTTQQEQPPATFFIIIYPAGLEMPLWRR